MYELSEAAASDLEGLFSASLDRFGIGQTERYVDELRDCLELLGQNPSMGVSADEVRAGYRRFPRRSHVVFYRSIPSGGVSIVRVLHERMDVAKQIIPKDHEA